MAGIRQYVTLVPLLASLVMVVTSGLCLSHGLYWQGWLLIGLTVAGWMVLVFRCRELSGKCPIGPTTGLDCDRLVEDVVRDVLDCMPHPAAVANKDGRLLNCNRHLEEWLGRPLNFNEDIGSIWPTLAWDVFRHGMDKDTIEHLGRWYRIIYHQLDCEQHRDRKLMLLYLIDVTEGKLLASRVLDTKPVIMLIKIDNCSELFHGVDESRKSQLLSEVYQILHEYFEGLDGAYKRLDEDDGMALIDRQGLNTMISDRFDILDKIRAVRVTGDVMMSVSIGAACGDMSILQLVRKAQAGLELAEGRGGDQAVVFYENRNEFFGGKIKPVEKNTQVKARLVAQAIKRAIADAATVWVMGHQNEDFDSLGAAIGVTRMAKLLGKRVYIVISRPGMAIDKIRNVMAEYGGEYDNILVGPDQAEQMIREQDLVFVVDVHKPMLTAGPALLTRNLLVIVIDHHRRAEDFIDNPMLVYLEPSASSTSELVTELIQYFDERIDLTRLEASLLFAGIVLDTKNFTIQVGVRTFEAAAALRRRGADPALARNLLRVDEETFRERAAIVSGVESLGNGIVMAACERQLNNAQVAASQAADMLLAIDGVRVSFVVFAGIDGEIGVSARSQGDVNVQVIMEKLGGGGHQTVAGAQIRNTTVSEVREQLKKIIGEELM
ncbi:MAG: DHH family phosphoesterase [Negativicutes bacterium]|nr:DHH family phosphoesterase [Negativicutes bacterium]